MLQEKLESFGKFIEKANKNPEETIRYKNLCEDLEALRAKRQELKEYKRPKQDYYYM